MDLDTGRRTSHSRRPYHYGFAQGKLGALALGTALGLVWTPCAGPVLASILTLIATANSLVSGAALLTVYAVGAAIPLLAIGWSGQAVTIGSFGYGVVAHGLLRPIIV
jgi:cytochrome c biogenesis protein CcdA